MSKRILVLPGIGDIYWVAVKLRAFCEREGIEMPEVHVWDFDGRPRSLGYVERIPFVKAGGYFQHNNDVPEFHESYMEPGRSVFQNLLGFDYYIALNGQLRHGRTVDNAMPGLKSDWFFELRRTEAEAEAAARYRERWPNGYIVAHLSDFGMFQNWVRAWDAQACARFINAVQHDVGLPVVLTGGTWDKAFSRHVASYAGCANLAGETNLDEFFALFRGAAGCVGWCGGNTILATAFKVPTLIVWSTYFQNPGFYRNACPPNAWGRWYDAAVVERDDPDKVARSFANLMEHAR